MLPGEAVAHGPSWMENCPNLELIIALWAALKGSNIPVLPYPPPVLVAPEVD